MPRNTLRVQFRHWHFWKSTLNYKGYQTICGNWRGNRMWGNLGECKWRVFLNVWQWETLMRNRKITGSSLASSVEFMEQQHRIGWLDVCWLLLTLSISEIPYWQAMSLDSIHLYYQRCWASHYDFLSHFLRCGLRWCCVIDKPLWSKYTHIRRPHSLRWEYCCSILCIIISPRSRKKDRTQSATMNLLEIKYIFSPWFQRKTRISGRVPMYNFQHLTTHSVFPQICQICSLV